VTREGCGGVKVEDDDKDDSEDPSFTQLLTGCCNENTPPKLLDEGNRITSKQHSAVKFGHDQVPAVAPTH
jgi:hypothetical protein